MTVLIDSWVWIEYLKGSIFGKKAKKYIEGYGEVLVSVINIAEIYKHMLQNKTENEADLTIKMISQRSFITPVNTKIAITAAKLKYENKYGLGDALIHATSKINNAAILTGDPHFKNDEDVIYIGK